MKYINYSQGKRTDRMLKGTMIGGETEPKSTKKAIDSLQIVVFFSENKAATYTHIPLITSSKKKSYFLISLFFFWELKFECSMSINNYCYLKNNNKLFFLFMKGR